MSPAGCTLQPRPAVSSVTGGGTVYDSVPYGPGNTLMPSDCEGCMESAAGLLAPSDFERWDEETTFFYDSGPILPAYGLTQAELDFVRRAVHLSGEVFRQTSIDWVLVSNPATWDDENRIEQARPFLAILAGRVATLLVAAAEEMTRGTPDGENAANAIALTLVMLAERAAPLGALGV